MSLSEIAAAVTESALTAGRDPGSVQVIAVSKEQPVDRVEAILAQGQRVFGENRVQEAQGRWATLSEGMTGLQLHLIGPLQTNKARAAVALFDTIHTVDRLRLAETLARLAQERGISPGLFVQVNTGAEPQKAGCLPEDVAALVAGVRAMDLPLLGLMCIPPAEQDPVPHFRMLARLANNNGLTGLSMGMSGDFRAAIAEGATHVRVGSAIFGDRAPRT